MSNYTYRHDLITAQMEREGITIKMLRDKTGRSKDTIQRACRGELGIAIGILLEIMEAINLPQRALLDNDYELPLLSDHVRTPRRGRRRVMPAS
jgi:hypothetical protein